MKYANVSDIARRSSDFEVSIEYLLKMFADNEKDLNDISTHSLNPILMIAKGDFSYEDMLLFDDVHMERTSRFADLYEKNG